MRNLNSLNDYRVRSTEMHLWGFVGDDGCGAFLIPSRVDSGGLRVIASSGFGWDHVSVSRKNRCPNWYEMSQIKELFFLDEEAVFQLHPAKADHINLHPHCLHLWRSQQQPIPMPPKWMVA